MPVPRRRVTREQRQEDPLDRYLLMQLLSQASQNAARLEDRATRSQERLFQQAEQRAVATTAFDRQLQIQRGITARQDYHAERAETAATGRQEAGFEHERDLMSEQERQTQEIQDRAVAEQAYRSLGERFSQTFHSAADQQRMGDELIASVTQMSPQAGEHLKNMITFMGAGPDAQEQIANAFRTIEFPAGISEEDAVRLVDTKMGAGGKFVEAAAAVRQQEALTERDPLAAVSTEDVDPMFGDFIENLRDTLQTRERVSATGRERVLEDVVQAQQVGADPSTTMGMIQDPSGQWLFPSGTVQSLATIVDGKPRRQNVYDWAAGASGIPEDRMKDIKPIPDALLRLLESAQVPGRADTPSVTMQAVAQLRAATGDPALLDQTSAQSIFDVNEALSARRWTEKPPEEVVPERTGEEVVPSFLRNIEQWDRIGEGKEDGAIAAAMNSLGQLGRWMDQNEDAGTWEAADRFAIERGVAANPDAFSPAQRASIEAGVLPPGWSQLTRMQQLQDEGETLAPDQKRGWLARVEQFIAETQTAARTTDITMEEIETPSGATETVPRRGTWRQHDVSPRADPQFGPGSGTPFGPETELGRTPGGITKYDPADRRFLQDLTGIISEGLTSRPSPWLPPDEMPSTLARIGTETEFRPEDLTPEMMERAFGSGGGGTEVAEITRLLRQTSPNVEVTGATPFPETTQGGLGIVPESAQPTLDLPTGVFGQEIPSFIFKGRDIRPEDWGEVLRGADAREAMTEGEYELPPVLSPLDKQRSLTGIANDTSNIIGGIRGAGPPPSTAGAPVITFFPHFSYDDARKSGDDRTWEIFRQEAAKRRAMTLGDQVGSLGAFIPPSIPGLEEPLPPVPADPSDMHHLGGDQRRRRRRTRLHPGTAVRAAELAALGVGAKPSGRIEGRRIEDYPGTVSMRPLDIGGDPFGAPPTEAPQLLPGRRKDRPETRPGQPFPTDRAPKFKGPERAYPYDPAALPIADIVKQTVGQVFPPRDDYPQDLSDLEAFVNAVIGIETSGGRRGQTSEAGAQGVMQLMPKTSAQHQVTDPFNRVQNVRGGVEHILELMKEPGISTIPELGGAYNAGATGLANALRAGTLTEETRNYMAEIAKLDPEVLERLLNYMQWVRGPVGARRSRSVDGGQ